MKKANCKENVPEATRGEVVIAVQQIDQDIQQRVKTLVPNSDLCELQEKVALSLQVERNDWRAKMQSVFRQLDNEHKKSQKVKNLLLDILNQYPVENDQHVFEEELEIKDLIKYLKEMIIHLKNVNQKLVQDLNDLLKSKDFSPTVTNKDGEKDLCTLKAIESENQSIQDQDLLECKENKSIGCCKLKDWCQYKSLVSFDCNEKSQDMFDQQYNESNVNKETEERIHEEPVTVVLEDKSLLLNQELMISKCKEHRTVSKQKNYQVKSYMNNHEVKMKDQSLKPSSKGYSVGGRARANNQKREILQCHQVNGYDIKTDHKNQIFQESFFCKLVTKGPIGPTYPSGCNKKWWWKKNEKEHFHWS